MVAGSLALQHIPPTIVAVAPTTTVICTIDAQGADFIALQLTNLDSTQTLSAYVQRKTRGETAWATSTLTDFSNLAGNGATAMADIDTRGGGYIRLVGAYDGAGGNAQVSAHRRASR